MPNPFTIPGAPIELMERINARRSRIPAGMMMMAGEQSQPDPESQQGDPQLNADAGDQPLGPAGMEALRKERDRADELDKQVKALSGQFAKLAQALGVDAKSDAAADLGAVVANLTMRLDVADLARTHGITDAEDIAALYAVTDETARGKLAARLAPAKGQQDDQTNDGQRVYPRPKPDASQGPKGEPAESDPTPGMERLRAAYAASSKK